MSPVRNEDLVSNSKETTTRPQRNPFAEPTLTVYGDFKTLTRTLAGNTKGDASNANANNRT